MSEPAGAPEVARRLPTRCNLQTIRIVHPAACRIYPSFHSVCSDLKPENILLDGDGHLALCDLGFAVKAERAYKRLG